MSDNTWDRNGHGEVNVLESGDKDQNVGEIERHLSLLAGSALALYGLKQRSMAGLGLALLGGALVHRGATGHCRVYDAMNVDTTATADQVAVKKGVKVEKRVTINKSPEELYRFWHEFENLPTFMKHLEAVQKQDENHSHWVAKAPAGRSVEWDAEIINDIPNKLIAWRSTENAEVANTGSVNFEKAPDGRGTVVSVVLQYAPPGGKVSAAVAKLFGEEPSLQIDEDLHRFKQLMEAGEVATTEGQPHG